MSRCGMLTWACFRSSCLDLGSPFQPRNSGPVSSLFRDFLPAFFSVSLLELPCVGSWNSSLEALSWHSSRIYHAFFRLVALLTLHSNSTTDFLKMSALTLLISKSSNCLNNPCGRLFLFLERKTCFCLSEDELILLRLFSSAPGIVSDPTGFLSSPSAPRCRHGLCPTRDFPHVCDACLIEDRM